MNIDKSSQDPTHTWVFGKATPGWYMARWSWNAVWAAHLEAKGYRVERSEDKPEN
jgi:hypothetical protein